MVRFPAVVRNFSLFLNVQTSSGAHPASYPMGTPGVTRPGSESDNSLPSTAEVKNDGAIFPLPHSRQGIMLN
jgi:hypothetical protein